MIKTLIRAAIEKVVRSGQLPESILTLDISIERPKSALHGDWTTTLALQAARLAKRPPREVAAVLVSHLDINHEYLAKAEIAGAGFVNFWMKPQFWFSSLDEVFRAGEAYGKLTLGAGKKVLVEFVSANPTGPLHVGHGRGAVVGDVMASILSWAGYDVDREYYVNDGGVQMGMLGASIAGRYDERHGREGTFPENGYRGDYIREIACEFDKDTRYKDMTAAERIRSMGEKGGAKILSDIMQDLRALGVVFDHVFYESSLYKDDRVRAILERLRDKGLAYEKDGALWLATSRFGDDKDRVLQKSDGSTTYFTPDIAYHCQKLERGYTLLVNVWGADHGGYVPRMQAALTALGVSPDCLHVLLIQMVQLISGGERVSMSTRAGEFEELASVRKEVGRDATRYFFLMRSYQAQLDFDLDLAKKRSAENPVYYIQYAHARIASIFRKAGHSLGEWCQTHSQSLPRLENKGLLPEELDLIRKVLEFKEMIELAAMQFEPHRPAFYLLELAKGLQQYYTRAREDKRYQILQADPELQAIKLCVLAAVGQTLKNGLTLLGIRAPEEM